jgi:dephospho-CoA kinase
VWETDSPLLFESGLHRLVSPIIVVWVNQELQLERLLRRDKSSKEDALNRINSQMPLTQKRDRAHFVIDNEGTLSETKQQVQDILQKIRPSIVYSSISLGARLAFIPLLVWFTLNGCMRLFHLWR